MGAGEKHAIRDGEWCWTTAQPQCGFSSFLGDEKAGNSIRYNRHLQNLRCVHNHTLSG